MLRQFGKKNKFEIKYELQTSPEKNMGIFEGSWGRLKMLVQGIDICEYSENEMIKDYTWNLYYIVEWLCEKMLYIIGYDPFPLPIQAQTAADLVEKTYEFETEDDIEEYLWLQAKQIWAGKHSWFSSRGGSILSDTYFRRIIDQIEISCCNDFWRSRGITFTNQRGYFMIPKTEFISVIFDFLFDIINVLGTRILGKADEDKLREWKQQLELLIEL